MGSPEDNDWEQAKNLPYYEEFHNKGKKNLNDVIFYLIKGYLKCTLKNYCNFEITAITKSWKQNENIITNIRRYI